VAHPVSQWNDSDDATPITGSLFTATTNSPMAGISLEKGVSDRGSIRTTGAGILQLRGAQNIAEISDLTIFAGSVMMVVRVDN